MDITAHDYASLARLPKGKWFALGAIGKYPGFPSATARRLLRLGLLERRFAPMEVCRTYDYRIKDGGESQEPVRERSRINHL